MRNQFCNLRLFQFLFFSFFFFLKHVYVFMHPLSGVWVSESRAFTCDLSNCISPWYDPSGWVGAPWCIFFFQAPIHHQTQLCDQVWSDQLLRELLFDTQFHRSAFIAINRIRHSRVTESNGFRAHAHLSDTVVRQTDFDVNIGQCLLSDRNLVCATLIKHKTLSDGEASVCSQSKWLDQALSYDSTW